MAVRAADPLVIHLALDERAIDIDFIKNLSITMVGLFVQIRQTQVVVECRPTCKFSVQQAATIT